MVELEPVDVANLEPLWWIMHDAAAGRDVATRILPIDGVTYYRGCGGGDATA